MRLREVTTEFDFSILWCASVSWLMATSAGARDGLVPVLTANKTSASGRPDQSQLPKPSSCVGTVLAERQFPVPQGPHRTL